MKDDVTGRQKII